MSDRRYDSLAVRTGDFERHLRWLKEHDYHSLTLAQFVNQQPEKDERVVIVTFDDGYADNYSVAFPILLAFGFVATIFVVTDYVDGSILLPSDKKKIRPGVCRDAFRMLTWTQIREMTNHGMEIGSHSRSHPRELTKLGRERCWDEIAGSRSVLRERLGEDIVSFCYPRGDVDEDTVAMVEEAGYGCAVVTPSRRGLPLNRYTLRRIGVYQGNGPLIFRLKTWPAVRMARESLKSFRVTR